MEQRIIKGLEQVGQDDVIMLCFTHAGGGASFYYRWRIPLEYSCKVCQVQLPGREERLEEKPYTGFKEPVMEIVDILMQYDNPIVLYGHSMGTKLAYEVEKELEKRGRKSELLIVSACPPPHVEEKNPIGHLPDEAFVEALIRMNGIPKAMQEEPEILKIFLPLLRADFILSEGYTCEEKVLLECPIRAMGGYEDGEAVEKELLLWKEYNPYDFSLKMFDGDHFYIREREKEVLKQIGRYILDATSVEVHDRTSA